MMSASSSLCFSTPQISDQMPFEYLPPPFIQLANDNCHFECNVKRQRNFKGKSDINGTVASSKFKKMSKIKYPPSAFLIFCKDYRASIHQKCPSLNPIDLTRLLSQVWKYLDPELKNTYLLKRQKIIEDFIVDHPNYNGETSVDPLESSPVKNIDCYFPLIHPNQRRSNLKDFDLNSFLSHFQ